jgi:hypothetical protein
MIKKIFTVLNLFIFLALCLFISVSQAKGKGIAMNSELKVNFTKSDDKLQLTYKLINNMETPVYIFNRLYDTDVMGNITLNPNRVYIYPEDENTLILAKMLIEIPSGMMVEAPEIPGLTKIGPHQEFSETLHLSLPLKMVHPYLRKGGSTTKTYKVFKFKLGILPDFPALKLHSSTLEGKTLITPEYGQALKEQKIISTQALSQALDLKP